MTMNTDVLLKVSGLRRSFGGLVAVDQLDFEIRRGEILGLIGPNGAGKSTTFNVISGFYRPTAGSLHFEGEDISGKSPAAISRKGLVRTFQHGSLMREMSVFDNIYVATITLFRDYTERLSRVKEIASMFNLADVLHETAGNLPHGRQRMLSMAIAFAQRPKLLCLDEPLTGLNQSEVGGAMDVFRRIRDEFGAAILLVEHNMKAVMEICDRIVVLNYGKLLTTGRPEEIRQNEQVIAAYLGKRK
jgi:branched-chain amino acid transport system ATP-binding protein